MPPREEDHTAKLLRLVGVDIAGAVVGVGTVVVDAGTAVGVDVAAVVAVDVGVVGVDMVVDVGTVVVAVVGADIVAVVVGIAVLVAVFACVVVAVVVDPPRFHFQILAGFRWETSRLAQGSKRQ